MALPVVTEQAEHAALVDGLADPDVDGLQVAYSVDWPLPWSTTT